MHQAKNRGRGRGQRLLKTSVEGRSGSNEWTTPTPRDFEAIKTFARDARQIEPIRGSVVDVSAKRSRWHVRFPRVDARHARHAG
jgi:hypothetical protein